MTQAAPRTEAAAGRGVARLKMLIGGEWRYGAAEFEAVDPYRGEAAARVPESSLDELDDALNAALAAKSKVAAMPGYERAMRVVCEEVLGPIMTEERLVLFNL
ncbi:MAG TPA: hypothetical protein VNF69_00560 [Burkholderiales bacterium]|nr:hypothetical protein [Burkholderiales bacterium]